MNTCYTRAATVVPIVVPVSGVGAIIWGRPRVRLMQEGGIRGSTYQR